jgi:hypothetical protein
MMDETAHVVPEPDNLPCGWCILVGGGFRFDCPVCKRGLTSFVPLKPDTPVRVWHCGGEKVFKFTRWQMSKLRVVDLRGTNERFVMIGMAADRDCSTTYLLADAF